MKKFLMTMCFLFVLCVGIGGYTTSAQAADYECVVTKNHLVTWTDGTNRIYLNRAGNKLYLKDETGTTRLLKSFKTDEDTSYHIVQVYEEKIYLQKMHIFTTHLYVYDLGNDTYKRVKKNCNVLNVSGKYMITTTYQPSDITPYPAYVYERTQTGIKKVATLGRYVSQPLFADGKIYYASYPKSGINVMHVYRCEENGDNPELLFTRKAAHRSGYIVMTEVTDGKILFAQNDDVDSERICYAYDLATGKITKSRESY